MKRGRLSLTEMQYIKDNIGKASVKEIAARLSRAESSVKNYAESKLGVSVDETNASILETQFDIRNRPFWRSLKEQFTTEELKLVVSEWSRYIVQFQDDVFATEESQIIDVLRAEVLINRNMKEQREALQSINKIEMELQKERSLDPGEQDRTRITRLEHQIAGLRAAQSAHSKNYKDLAAQKEKTFQSLKATRDQRLKQVTESADTFPALFKKLMTDPEYRREAGERMEKMRHALYQEEKRLAGYHTYEDGDIDQPLLSMETVLEDNKIEGTD